uniref:Uncharacterized protein n=1 Tax=Sphaeramia orbicularis TaxID=375764 RepID=A0A672Y639_9TELE
MAKTNYVGKLSELTVERHWKPPVYEEPESTGPDNCKRFTVKVHVADQLFTGEGTSKKEAKHDAAKKALEHLRPELAQASARSTADENINHPSAQQKDELASSDLCDKTRELSVSSDNQSSTQKKTDFISLLMTKCQRTGHICQFIEVERKGPSHDPEFFCKAVIDSKEYPVGKGKSKKEARKNAAELAWSVLGGHSDWDSKVSTLTLGGLVLDLVVIMLLFAVCSSKDAAQVQNVGNNSTQSSFTSDFDSIKRLGSGGFGSVYKARDKKLERYYAVKIIDWEEHSLREVKALSDLSHPNIVRYYSYWEETTGYKQRVHDPEEKFLYIQMELCDSTLRQWINGWSDALDDSKRREEGLKIAQQILSGVEYIHSMKCIHRDLKPDNILFRERVVKIGDFGLVTRDDDDAGMERTRRTGTPSYMAPEQEKERTYNRKVDIFALGLIFFEILWKMTGHERSGIWNDVRRQRFPEEFTRSFCKESDIIKSMLQNNPEDRPEAGSLKADLDRWIQVFGHDQMLQENKTI